MSSSTSHPRNVRKTLLGFVTSRSGAKSVKVTIPYKTPHPLYHKVINRKTVVHVHDEKDETKVGDKVLSGLMKDTISMPRYSTAEIDFIANDSGPTFFHCHHQDHMDEGFAGLIAYE